MLYTLCFILYTWATERPRFAGTSPPSWRAKKRVGALRRVMSTERVMGMGIKWRAAGLPTYGASSNGSS